MSRSKGLRSLFATVGAVVALTAVMVAPASAVTNGTLDGNGHPYIGLVTFHGDNGNYLWRCSGTLVAPTVFLTAGHCTEPPAASAHVWFDAGPVIPDPDFTLETRSCGGINGYPCGGYDASGTPNVHPDYNPDAFWLFDLGIVELDSPVVMSTYGVLPELNQLDALKPSRKTTFTSVGYGLQKAFPDAAAWKDVAIRQRMVAHPYLLQINTGFTGDYSLLLCNNASSGGTCFGDSGGPNFIGNTNVIAGVTSYGLNWTCAGTGGVYRVDRADDLEWIATFL
jgi:hypothetical protein